MPDPSPLPHNLRWRIGTMGFSYPGWAEPNAFYPPGTKPAEYLKYYARCFDTLELDTTFYAAPDPARVRRWADAVPEHFRFSLKTPRDITHAKDLADTLPLMDSFLTSIRSFGPKLLDGGFVLLQFPPSFPASKWPQLQTLIRSIPTDIPLAAEFRHVSWWKSPDIMKLMDDYHIAWTSADYVGSPRELRITANKPYLRLIGQHERFPAMNKEQLDVTADLQWWKDQLSSAHIPEAWVLFNNDYAGFSIATAERLKKLLNLPTPRPPAPTTTLFG